MSCFLIYPDVCLLIGAFGALAFPDYWSSWINIYHFYCSLLFVLVLCYFCLLPLSAFVVLSEHIIWFDFLSFLSISIKLYFPFYSDYPRVYNYTSVQVLWIPYNNKIILNYFFPFLVSLLSFISLSYKYICVYIQINI